MICPKEKVPFVRRHILSSPTNRSVFGVPVAPHSKAWRNSTVANSSTGDNQRMDI